MKAGFDRSSKSQDLASLTASWSQGKFHSVYLFAGTDTLQKEEAVKLFQKHFLGADESGLSVDRFEGESAGAGQILNAVKTFSLLGDRRLVLVRRTHEMSPAETNRLADELASLPPGNSLILLWDEKADARNVLVQAVKSSGVVITFWVPFEDQLPRWVQERAHTLGKTISGEVARALLASVGPNPEELAQELEKISLYVKDKKEIDLAAVETFRPDTRTLQFLELDRALWRRDTAKALGLLEILRAQGQPPEAILAQLVRVYRKLFLAKVLLSEKKATPAELWDYVWIRTRQPQGEFLEALPAFSWEDLLDAFESLLKAERDLKTGRLDPVSGVTLLVYKLTGGKKGGLAGSGEKAVNRA